VRSDVMRAASGKWRAVSSNMNDVNHEESTMIVLYMTYTGHRHSMPHGVKRWAPKHPRPLCMAGHAMH
jgi:hypothetical protein